MSVVSCPTWPNVHAVWENRPEVERLMIYEENVCKNMPQALAGGWKPNGCRVKSM